MVQKVELYGGAITTTFPEGFLDASMLREVADTQEVYVNSRQPGEQFNDGLGLNESIIVDLLEQLPQKNKELALREHLEDIFQLNDSHNNEVVKIENPNENTITCIAVEEAHKWGKKDMKEAVVTCVGLIRMNKVTTDVLITLNIPLQAETFDLNNLPEHALAGYKVLQSIIANFRVVDESLFV